MRLVVIGGVAAGLSAASRARRLDPHAEIIVLERGDSISHAACGLPYYVDGTVPSASQLVTYTADYFRRERGIDVRTGSTVSAIEHHRRAVTLASGERIGYDSLVIATGARPALPVDSVSPNVFTLHTPDDAQRLREFLQTRRPRTGIVIGAGYIGLEAAGALRAHGVRVKVISESAHALGREDSLLTRRIREYLEQFHVDLILGERVNNPSDLQADVVISAGGLRPNTELAAAAGIETGRTGAIRVTERMETNLSRVYAAGDCAETVHLVTGRPIWLPLGTTANKMGRIAGANAAGARERFPGIAGTSIVSICGWAVAVTGLSAAEAKAHGFDAAAVTIQSRDRAAYMRSRPMTVELVGDRRSGRLLGATITGEREVAGRINVVATALAARMTIESLEQLDLAYAPPFSPVWDPLLIAAQQLRKELSS